MNLALVTLLSVLFAPALSWAGASNLGVVDVSTSGVYVTNSQLLIGTTQTLQVEIASGDTTKAGKRLISSTGEKIKVGAPESAEILVVNYSTSGKDLIIDRQFFASIDQGVNLLFRLYRLPVFTSSGTAIGSINAYLGNAKSTAGQMFFQPTTSSFGTIVNTYQVRDNMIIDETSGRIIIPPGGKVLLTVESSGNNKKWSYSMAWVEEPV